MNTRTVRQIDDLLGSIEDSLSQARDACSDYGVATADERTELLEDILASIGDMLAEAEKLRAIVTQPS